VELHLCSHICRHNVDKCIIFMTASNSLENHICTVQTLDRRTSTKVATLIVPGPVPVVARSKAQFCGRSPAEIVGSNPARRSVYCGRCVLSGRGLRDELITRPEESYRIWCVVVCDLEIS
jgi:hypothetical protein